jgi:hypothetical protein
MLKEGQWFSVELKSLPPCLGYTPFSNYNECGQRTDIADGYCFCDFWNLVNLTNLGFMECFGTL